MARKKGIDNVLILHGGGSLVAFVCGVFKAIAQSHVKIDIHTRRPNDSGINVAIIAGSKRINDVNLHLNNSGSNLQETPSILYLR